MRFRPIPLPSLVLHTQVQCTEVPLCRSGAYDGRRVTCERRPADGGKGRSAHYDAAPPPPYEAEPLGGPPGYDFGRP